MRTRYLAQLKSTDWSFGMITAITRLFFRGSASSSGSTSTTFQTLAGTAMSAWPLPISSLGASLP